MQKPPTHFIGRHWLLITIDLLLLLAVVGVQFWELNWSPRSSNREVIVALEGSGSSVTMYGIEIRAVNNFLLDNTGEEDRAKVEEACGANYSKLKLPEDVWAGASILKDNIMVITARGNGSVCLAAGDSYTFGPIEVTAGEVAKPAANSINVQELIIRESKPWVFMATTLLSFLLTLFVGTFTAVLVDKAYRKR